MMRTIDKIGIDAHGNDVFIDWKNTNIEYHLLETPNLVDLVKEVVHTIETNRQPQVVVERDMGRIVGATNLVETSEGDEIVYARRKGRDAYSRFVRNKALIPTRNIVVVLRKTDRGYNVWTAMCGNLLPPEAYISNSTFSRTHAMVYDETLIQLDPEMSYYPSGQIQFLPPNVTRDAPFAHSWFTRPEGRATLLCMGNAESEIEESTLEAQREIMQEFIDLEKEGRQITRVIMVDDVTVGVVWIELFENHGVKSPSVHIMIGNPDYRGRGIGRNAMRWVIEYVRDTLHETTIYSRHLANNVPIAKLNASLGFVNDGEVYADENGSAWQNVVMLQVVMLQ